jgi:hypothetical protein
MGLYLRPSRFLKVRVTRRGTRWAIGPLAASAPRCGRRWRLDRGGGCWSLVQTVAAAQQKITMRR